MAAGVTSGGGAAAFVLSKFYRSNKQIKTDDNKTKIKEVERKKDELNQPGIVYPRDPV
jgi:hypothetical protein